MTLYAYVPHPYLKHGEAAGPATVDEQMTVARRSRGSTLRWPW